ERVMSLRLIALWSMLLVAPGFHRSLTNALQSPDHPHPNGPDITVVSVTFENVTQLSTADQDAIAADLKSRSYHGPDWLSEFDERARNAWQQRGYFGAKAHSNSHQRNDDPAAEEVTTTVEE